MDNTPIFWNTQGSITYDTEKNYGSLSYTPPSNYTNSYGVGTRMTGSMMTSMTGS